MDPTAQEERKRVVEAAREQLAAGTWPQVMSVFGYPTPKAKRHTDTEVSRLKDIFQTAGHLNMVAFIDLVLFEEERLAVPMSFNFVMRRRITPGSTPTLEEVVAFLACPDVLVGTRWGNEAAFKWLEKFVEEMTTMPKEMVQIFDKIFGEAVQLLQKGAVIDTTVEGLMDIASGKEEMPKAPPSTAQ